MVSIREVLLCTPLQFDDELFFVEVVCYPRIVKWTSEIIRVALAVILIVQVLYHIKRLIIHWISGMLRAIHKFPFRGLSVI